MILTYISREPLGIEDSTNEFIQSKKSEEDSNTNAVMAPARREAEKVNQDLDTSEDDRDKPLTILQLSPRKRPAVQDDPLLPSSSARPDVLLCTRRLSNKRPMTLDSTSEEQQNKKRKHEFKAAEEVPIVPKKEPNARPRLPSSRPQTRMVKPRSNSGSTLRTASSSSSGPKLPTREFRKAKRIVSQPAVFNPGTGWND